jgi:DNA relaxase NicK
LGYALSNERGNGSVFDAYLATVYAHPLLLLDHLEQALMDAGEAPQRVDGPPVRFYGSNTLLVDPDGSRLLSVRHGGRHNPHPFVECKGKPSAAVADMLRSTFEHAPARLDSAIDRHGPNLMHELNDLSLDFERRLGLKRDTAGADLDNWNRGSTVYLGSRTSQAFLRIYQKGLQIAEEMKLTGDAIPDELRYWVRIELEYKPDKRPARMKAVGLSPDALWGCSPWTQNFARLALQLDAKRVHMNVRRESNHDRSMRFLVQQYGPTILAQVKALGSWERFTEDLQERLGVNVYSDA